MANRSTSWDAIGVGAYGLVFSLIESTLVFILLWLLSFLLPKTWGDNKRVSFLGLLYFLLAAWLVVLQVFGSYVQDKFESITNRFLSIDHPLRASIIFFALIIVCIYISFAYTALRFIKNEKLIQLFDSFIDRISVLSTLYLVVDLIGVVIIILRNI
jgi:uncharacterized membrane protein